MFMSPSKGLTRERARLRMEPSKRSSRRSFEIRRQASFGFTDPDAQKPFRLMQPRYAA